MGAAGGDRGCRQWGGCERGVVAAGIVRGAGTEVMIAPAVLSSAACCDRTYRFCCWRAVRTVVSSMRTRIHLMTSVNPICLGQTSIEREAVAALK